MGLAGGRGGGAGAGGAEPPALCAHRAPLADALRGGGYAEALQSCLSEMHIRRRVSLRLCPTVSSPMLMGLLHPVILLPDEELTTEELRWSSGTS